MKNSSYSKERGEDQLLQLFENFFATNKQWNRERFFDMNTECYLPYNYLKFNHLGKDSNIYDKPNSSRAFVTLSML